MELQLLDKLSKEQEDLILEDIKYTRKQLNEDLKHIRKWLNNQHHLPPSRLKESDSFLIQYLTGCKGSLETVKRKMDCYYTFRGYSETCDDRDPMSPVYTDVTSICEMAVLPNFGNECIRLIMGTFADIDPQKFDYLTYCKLLVNRCEINMRLSGYCTRSYMLFDCKGATASLVLQIRPSIVKDMIVLVEDALPLRLMKIAMINAPTYIEVTLNKLVRPFLSKKLKERFHITSGGYEDLLNYFSPSVLPRDYGGDKSNPSLKEYSALWSKYEQLHRQWFLNELSEHTDESKRINVDNIPKNPYFGVHGSLKKLVID